MRIEIIGPSASGKTTLGRSLAQEYHVPHYQKDNIIWSRSPGGDTLRPDAECAAIYAELLREPDWILDGVFWDSLNAGMAVCDCIIVLDERLPVRLMRLFRRLARQRRGLEPCNTPPTAGYLLFCIWWMVFREPFRRRRMYKMLSAYSHKTAFFRSADDAFRFLGEKYPSPEPTAPVVPSP